LQRKFDETGKKKEVVNKCLICKTYVIDGLLELAWDLFYYKIKISINFKTPYSYAS
jgi:hypothetical protein